MFIYRTVEKFIFIGYRFIYLFILILDLAGSDGWVFTGLSSLPLYFFQILKSRAERDFYMWECREQDYDLSTWIIVLLMDFISGLGG